jgi:hypothetical protein
VIASGIGGVHTLLSNYDLLKEKGPRRVSPLAIPMLMPNGPAASVALEVGARGGVHTPVSACSSGAEAMAYALNLIRSGRVDVVIAGGTRPRSTARGRIRRMMALSGATTADRASAIRQGQDGSCWVGAGWSCWSRRPGPAGRGSTPVAGAGSLGRAPIADPVGRRDQGDARPWPTRTSADQIVHINATQPRPRR